MDKFCYATLNWTFEHLSMLELNLIRISKMGPSCAPYKDVSSYDPWFARYLFNSLPLRDAAVSLN